MFINKEEIELIKIALMARVNDRRNLILEINELNGKHDSNVINGIQNNINNMRTLINKLSEQK